MRITKLGHCCLFIEVTLLAAEDGSIPLVRGDTPLLSQTTVLPLIRENKPVRILTDPGAWSTRQNEVRGVDVILITHEHQDHFHLESLKTVLKNNPSAKVITNRGVGKLLDKEGIAHELLEDKQSKSISGILLEGFGEKHAVIYKEFGQVVNTGYFIANRFFYPGDAFYNPQKPVEILALPVCGPWMKMAEAIDYAKALKPKIAFPVHDGMLKIIGPFHGVPQALLPQADFEFRPATEGTIFEF